MMLCSILDYKITMLSSDLKVEEKLKIIEKEYNIPIESNIRKWKNV